MDADRAKLVQELVDVTTEWSLTMCRFSEQTRATPRERIGRVRARLAGQVHGAVERLRLFDERRR